MSTPQQHAAEVAEHYIADDERYPRYNLEGELQPITPADWLWRGATYEWRCLDCDGPPLYLGAAGGELPFECDCDHSGGSNVGVAVLVAGKRFDRGTAADINRPTPHPHWTAEKAA